MMERAKAMRGPLPKISRALGYASSLRPYSVSALSNRALRRSMRLVRRLPGGRRVLPVLRNGLHVDGTADTCPTVDASSMKAGLESLGVAVERFQIDRDAFEAFLRDARFPPWYYPHDGAPSAAFLEKTLEHYVASRLLGLAADDVYVDVGADNSPFSEIAERLFGCRAYQLDAAYRRGVRGRYVGCDVRSVALPDDSVDKMAAHCAFDHFQGDADRAFLSEAARVLRAGGRLCILPLYLSDVTTNYVDPSAWLTPPVLDDGARVIDVTGWGYEFSRYYAPQAFVEFAASQSATLSLRVFEVIGAEAIHASCYLRLAALFERK